MEVLSVEYLGVSSTEATLRFKSGEEELEGTVLCVLSIHGSFDKLFHPFCATKLVVWHRSYRSSEMVPIT